MVGAKGRSGRPRGSLSHLRNPTALAGHHLNILIEAWLAGVPIQVSPDKCLAPPTELRYTVPPRIKRVLAEIAIQHILNISPGLKRPDIEQVLVWARRRAPSVTLRRKARTTVDEREMAYREYDKAIAAAWKRK
jgi:hypothetical protein